MYLFDYLGAVYYWLYLTILRKVQNKESPSFADIREGKGRYNEGDVVDQSAYGMKLKIIGVIVTMIILHLIVRPGI